MKKKSLIYLFLFSILLINSSSNAQFGIPSAKIMYESGDEKFDFLMGQTTLKVEYIYDGMAVGKFKTEEEYVRTKVKEHNDSEPGKGDKWKSGWINARKERYEPKFEELINKGLAKKIDVRPTNLDAKYTLIIKTTFTEVGYNIGISKYPAFINVDYIFVETANPSNVVAKFYAQNLLGAQAMGFDFDAGSRIAESYARAGKMMAKYITEKALKK